MITDITPVLLTYNEEQNISRTLSRLKWANDIVVVDSYSTDQTLSILNSIENIRIFKRKFDNHANQWNYAIQHTQIKTDWVLALDADYYLPQDILSEIAGLSLDNGYAGYTALFLYCIDGRPINGSLYPPVTLLYKKVVAEYIQDGHTQRVQIDGKLGKLQSAAHHDDRKSFPHWYAAQLKYAALEAHLIRTKSYFELSWPDRIRRLLVFAPILVPIYILFVKGAIFSGSRGFRYAGQRFIAESILSYTLLFRV